MKWGVLLYITFFFYSMGLFAQKYHIEGFIRDSFTKEAIDSVNIALLNHEDSSVVEEFLCVKFGMWQCYRDIQEPGKYIMRFSKKGFHTAYKYVDFKYVKYRKTWSSFGEVLMYRIRKPMEDRTQELGEVVVTATKIKMVMKGDTVIYNADAFQLANGSMLDDLMKMLPGMEIHPDGQIFMNGEKLHSLLVNGEDFFKGDPKVALDNLPAYMVDKVKVYGRLDDRLVALGMTSEEMQKNKLPLVVDVNLKREYSVGLVGNVIGGYGTDKHYLARLFSLYFGPYTRIAVIGNSNDMADNSYFNKDSQQWNELNNAAGNTTTHGVWLEFLHTDETKKWKLSDNIRWNWREEEAKVNESTTTFIESGNVYSRLSSSNRERYWNIALTGMNSYAPRQGLLFEFQPDVHYENWNNNGGSLSADYSKQLAERYMGEALDSLFIPGSSEQYRNSLLSSLFVKSVYKSEQVYVGGKLKGDVRFLERQIRDRLHFGLGGSYEKTKSLSLGRNGNADGENVQTRFAEQIVRDYECFADARYIYALRFCRADLDIVPKYSFNQKYISDHRPYYQLAGSDFDNWDVDDLSSAKDELIQVMDRTNTYYSAQWGRRQEIGFDVDISSYSKSNDNVHNDHRLSMDIKCGNIYDKLHYERATVDTLVHRSEWFFLPVVEYSYQHYTDKIRNNYSLRYDLSSEAPWIGYRVNFRDDATPLIVRYNNPKLGNAHTHHVQFKFHRQNYRKTSVHNLAINYNLWQNMLCQSMTYDANTGVRTYCPETINGNWGLDGKYSFNIKIFPKWDIRFSSNTDLNFRHSVDYVSLVEHPQSVRSLVDRLLVTQSLNIYYGRNGIHINISASGTWNHSEGNRFNTLNAIDFNYGANLSFPIVWGITGQTQLRMYSRRGYSDYSFNTDQFIWNISLRKNIVKGKLDVKADVFDILNNMSSYGYSINAQMQKEIYRNVLRRYAMLSLIYRFNVNQ